MAGAGIISCAFLDNKIVYNYTNTQKSIEINGKP